MLKGLNNRQNIQGIIAAGQEDKMSAVAIITARGGSKRIPRKNVKMFCGKPILAYSIEASLSSGLFDEVMVSTDDGEIASIAQDRKSVV